jgi:hypothetical protein
MSAPIRFLVGVVAGWALVRATALGAISGFTISYATPRNDPPPLVPTEFPPMAELQGSDDPGFSAPVESGFSPATFAAPQPMQLARPYYVPAYLPQELPAASPPLPPRPAWHLPSETSFVDQTYPSLPSLPAAETVFASFPNGQSVPTAVGTAVSKPKLDRWQVSSWALLRGPSYPDSLASGGTLGGSQAGARILYAFNRSLSASIRTSSPVGGSRGAEIAAGIRWVPLRSIPIAITAERRQSISRFGGRSDFALFMEGGLYRKRVPLNFRLDGYFQAGVVGISRRDLFVDGQLALSRPVWGRFSAGLGVWGGAQPGLYRLDVGPRISMRVRDNIYAHLDWRQRLAGSAQPASGPALTLAADF